MDSKEASLYERPTMETHRCRGEEEKEEGVQMFEEMNHIYRGGGLKKRGETINAGQKTCRNTFFNLTTVQIV